MAYVDWTSSLTCSFMRQVNLIPVHSRPFQAITVPLPVVLQGGMSRKLAALNIVWIFIVVILGEFCKFCSCLVTNVVYCICNVLLFFLSFFVSRSYTKMGKLSRFMTYNDNVFFMFSLFLMEKCVSYIFPSRDWITKQIRVYFSRPCLRYIETHALIQT